MLEIEVKDFNIAQIADSGQCFRWNKVDDMFYRGVVGNSICEIKQIDDKVSVLGMEEQIFKKYFDLDRDYREIKDILSNDAIMEEAIKYGEGIRILNQDKFETLISFIISANNNIPRIKKSVEAISRKFGRKIDGEFYSFPTPIELGTATEEELRECGVGFRAKYIVKTCHSVLSGFDLEAISKLPLNECKNELMKLTGVGPKIADCVMLFSMQKADAFPIDVWIKNIMGELYGLKDTKLKEIENFAKTKFSGYSGIAQQYLFVYAREKKKNV